MKIVWNKAIWVLLLCSLCFSPAIYALKIEGEMEAQYRQTPEYGELGRIRLKLSGGVQTRNNTITTKIDLMGLGGERGLWYQLIGTSTSLGTFGMGVKGASIKASGSLFEGGPSADLCFGDIALNYSPYTLRLDGSHEGINPYARGISLDNFYLGRMQFAGFMVWEDKPHKKAYGSKLSYDAGSFSSSLIYVKYVDNNLWRNADGTLRYSEPEEIDQVTSWEGTYKINDNATIKAFYAANYKMDDENENTVRAFKVDFENNVSSNLVLAAGYLDFQPGFGPRYADRTPLFDPEDGSLLEWNPVERYAGKEGYVLNLATKNLNPELSFRFEKINNRVYTPQYVDKFIFGVGTTLSGFDLSLNTGFYQFLDTGSDDTENMQQANTYSLNAKRTILSRLSFVSTLNCYANYRDSIFYDDGVSGTWRGTRQSILGVNVDTAIVRGPLTGLEVSLGLKNKTRDTDSVLYRHLSLNYRTPAGITVQYIVTLPNTVEPLNPRTGEIVLYDEEGLYTGIDNLLQLQYAIKF